MLTLTGSLLADPTNPPPPASPPIPEYSPSLSPDPGVMYHESPLSQSQHVNNEHVETHSAYDKELQPQAGGAIEHEVIDERFLSARDLKKRRKLLKKEKRDDRKARKDERSLIGIEAVAGRKLVESKGVIPEDGGKRKHSGAVGRGMPKKKREK